MAAKAGDRNDSLDWLRVVSILYVTAFWHLLNYSEALPFYHHPVFWRCTVLALALFTLISGYLMGRGEPPVGRAALWDFYVRRLIRIYPPYLLAIVIFMALRLTGRAALLKGALLLGMVVPPPPPTLWFVGMIVLFYIVTPLLLRLAANMMRFVLVIGAVTLALWLLHLATPLIDPRLPLYLPAYAAGILLARREPVCVTPAAWAALATGTVASAAISIPAGHPADQSVWMAPFALIATIAAFLLFNHRLPHNRLIARVSFASFFLYLLHRPIYQVLMTVIHPPDGLPRLVLLWGVGLPLSIVAGYAAQAAYDRLVVPRLRRRSAAGPR